MGDELELSDLEIAEFARVYSQRLAAEQVLEAAGLERGRQPGWNASSAVEFWSAVARLLANGAAPAGLRRLRVLAHEQFPGNETFATGARAVARRERVPISWETVRAAWPLPSPLVERPALVEAVADELTMTGAGPVGLVGMGGAGKSTTARAVLHDPRIGASFPDGALWVQVNPDADVAAVQTRVVAAFGDPRPVLDPSEGRDRIRGLLAGAICLIVLDDVWEQAVVEAFPRLAGVRLLVTSRSGHVLPMGASVLQVGLVDDAAAQALLAAYARRPVPHGLAARRVLDRCGGLAVALAISGGLVRDQWDWDEIADAFDQADLHDLRARFSEYPYPSLLTVITAGLRLLPDGAAARLAELAVFKGHGPVPVAVVLDLWAATGAVDGRAGRGVLRHLDGASLLRLDLDTQTVTAHDLVFDFARGSLSADRFAALHGLIAHRFLDRWGGLDTALGRLPPAHRRGAVDRYALTWTIDHLLRADQPDAVDALLTAERHTPDGRAESVWYTAHEDQATTADYLTAVHAARDHTQAADSATVLARHALYALLLGSITSLAANIPRPCWPGS